MKRRGTTLVGAIGLVAIALLALFTVATAASFNLQLVQQTENVNQASLLAESAVQQAIAELGRDTNWGTNVATDKVNLTGPDGSNAQISFDPANPRFSTNNQTGAHGLGWSQSRLLSGAVVPKERVHLVAVGRYRNVVRVREALVYVPNFTVALASSGSVHLTNSLVGSLSSPADLANLASNPQLLGPGDLASNSADAQSVVLDQNSRVSGNLQSCGGVVIESGSTVGGEVRGHFSSATLPKFSIDQYDPASLNSLNVGVLLQGPQPAQDLTGLVRCAGSSVIQGDLHLDNSLLFVVGDLTVEGGVTGSGAVIVKGKTRVQGGTNLTSDDVVALISKGDLELIGDQPKTYTFQGLVYTQGNFTAKNFTVVGGFVADGSTTTSGQVFLQDSQAYHTPVATHVDLFYPRQIAFQAVGGVPPIPMSVTTPGDTNVVLYGQDPAALNPAAPAPWTWNTPVLAATFPNPGGQWPWWSPVYVQISREKVAGKEQLVYTLEYNDGGNPIKQKFFDQTSAAAALKALGDAKRMPKDEAIVGTTTVAEFEAMLSSFSNANALPGQQASANFSFDPNRFLQNQDKLRISTWVEY